MYDFSNEPPAVEGIIRELLKPQNRDLLAEVIGLGDGSPEQSFMWGFTQSKPLGFDDFASFTHTINAQLAPALGFEPDERPMSIQYDEYLARLEMRNGAVSLNQAQTKRFEDIVNPFDDGWSGAYYAVLMRHIQARLRQMFNN